MKKKVSIFFIIVLTFNVMNTVAMQCNKNEIENESFLYDLKTNDNVNNDITWTSIKYEILGN